MVVTLGGFFHFDGFFNFRFLFLTGYAIIFMLSYPIRQRKGGGHMEILASFLVAVMAGVACHYIIKWLDGDNNDN